MEGNNNNKNNNNNGSGGSGNGNELFLVASSVPPPPSVVTEAKKLTWQVIGVLSASEVMWNMWMSSRLTILHRLYAEYTDVSEKFIDYYRLWRGRDHTVSENNIATFHRFTEIDEQTGVLAHMLDDYETKLQRAGEIVIDFNRDTKAHIRRIRSSLEGVASATTLADLEQVEVPNLNWIDSFPDPEIEILSEEWNELQLDTRISACLQELQALVNNEMVANPSVG